MSNVLKTAKDLVGKYGTVVYLTEYGSRLYGTNDENSDHDFKGIFVPSLESLILKEDKKTMSFTTGNEFSKNSMDDVDIQLWSVQYWCELLSKGDTNAIDLLFSLYSKSNNYVYASDKFTSYIQKEKCIDFIDMKSNNAYVSYAYAQASKYGLKGSRLSVLKGIIETLVQADISNYSKAGDYFDMILCFHQNDSLCFEKYVNGERFLYILGKGYGEGISTREMYSRLVNTYEKYGERARLAEMNEGIDWKAVSHAFRCCLQIEEIINTGFLQYPLKDACFLKDIKHGKISWKTLNDMLFEKISGIERKISTMESRYDEMKSLHKEFILYLCSD